MNDVLRTAVDYRHYAQKKANAHFTMAEASRKSHRRLGIPATIAGAVAGTSLFATLSKPGEFVWVQVATGFLALAGAVLSALHTFLNFSDVERQHRAAAAQFEATRHDLDQFVLLELASEHRDQREAITTLREIARRFDAIAEKAPTIPDPVYDSTRTALDKLAARIASEHQVDRSPQPG